MIVISHPNKQTTFFLMILHDLPRHSYYVITGIFVIEIYEEENLLFEILLSWIVLKILVKVAENR